MNGTTLLIVDDHPSFRLGARALLEAAGFVIVGEAASGEEAIDAVRRLQPQVVLLDIVLPDLDGFTVCQRLAEDDPVPAIVLTSSRDASAYRRRLRRSAARGFISKPDLTGAALTAMIG